MGSPGRYRGGGLRRPSILPQIRARDIARRLPEGAAQQADAFSATMIRAVTFRIEGDRLELRDEAGALQVAFRAWVPRLP